MTKPGTGKNHLLAALPRADYLRLETHLRPYEMQVRDEVEVSTSGAFVLFPIDGVISLVTTMEDGSMVEAATVGNEGMFGIPTLHPSDGGSLDAFVQIPGRAWRIPSSLLRAEMTRSESLRRVVERYSGVLFSFVARSAACNTVHTLRQRCAKWLLLAHDRVMGDAFLLTQEFLAEMLGVRRATVTVAAGLLRNEGFIRYQKGRIQIVNREGLELVSCECYRVLRDEFDGLSVSTGR